MDEGDADPAGKLAAGHPDLASGWLALAGAHRRQGEVGPAREAADRALTAARAGQHRKLVEQAEAMLDALGATPTDDGRPPRSPGARR